MPLFTITLNFGISERLLTYITTTYSSNIHKIRKSENFTQFRVEAPTQESLDAALADIRSRLVEIEPEV